MSLPERIKRTLEDLIAFPGREGLAVTKRTDATGAYRLEVSSSRGVLGMLHQSDMAALSSPYPLETCCAVEDWLRAVLSDRPIVFRLPLRGEWNGSPVVAR